LKVVRNKTTLEQQTFVDGKRYTLAAYEEKPFPDAVANSFLVESGEVVEQVTDSSIGGIYSKPVERLQTVWVANVMGDPDAPAEVEISIYDRDIRRYKNVKVENQKRIPRPVTRQMGGGMEEYQTEEGLMARNLPPTTITVPPFQRREMPAAIGTWFLTRDANIFPAQFRQQVVKSRAPSPNEPKMDWALDDMRCYLYMTDRKAILGPTQKEIEAANPDKSALELAIHEAKLLCMKRLHFRIAPEGAKVYGQKEFEEFRRGFEKPIPTISSDAVQAAIAKNQSGKLAPGLSGNSPL
jgi:hypothetical protein